MPNHLRTRKKLKDWLLKTQRLFENVVVQKQKFLVWLIPPPNLIRRVSHVDHVLLDMHLLLSITFQDIPKVVGFFAYKATIPFRGVLMFISIWIGIMSVSVVILCIHEMLYFYNESVELYPYTNPIGQLHYYIVTSTCTRYRCVNRSLITCAQNSFVYKSLITTI